MGAAYVLRTSFVVDGERVFTLWDDAMISMRYAANLWAGHGLQWNAEGPAVQGISNLALSLGMALLHGLPVDRFAISAVFQGLCLAALLAQTVLVESVARRLTGDPRAGLAAAVALAASAPVAIWALQGADTVFVSGWMLLGLWAIAPRRGGARWPGWLFALLAAGLWLRMDLALPAAVLGIASLALPAAGRGAWWRAAGGAAQGLAALAALLAFQWLYYGDPLPNTYYL